MAGPSIVTTSPASGATGVPTNVTISITFDQEVDTYRLKNGGVFLEGPDQSKVIGPGMLSIEPPETDEDDFLSSPAYKGIVECDYAFYRVDGSGESVDYYDYGNTSGAGQLYRTKVVLTPKEPLESLTEHSVYIIGDEDTSDDYDFGLTTRSVFDPLKGPNIGTGDVIFYGGYTGSTRQQFSIEITTAGAPGTAQYEWWTSTDSTHRTGTSSLGYRFLKEGVKVKFLEGQIYQVGDLFTVWCDVPEFMDGSYKFSFTTSSSAPEELPESSTLLTGIDGTSTTSGTFSVESSNPADREALVSSDLTSITITFSDSIDSTTVTSSTVLVEGHAVNGSTSGDIDYTETLTTSLTVSGSILTITLDADEIYDNNIIAITLDSSIADTDGNTLTEDYSFFFGTELTPFYAGIRSVVFRLGTLGNYYPEETIALAIWEASKEADAFALPSTTITNTVGYARAKEQFVICFAAWLLISGGGGATGESVRKRLSDFDVSRSPSSNKGLDDDLKSCITYYENIMANGGNLYGIHKPLNVVKGDTAVDEPHYGRLWEIPDTPVGNTKVLYSGTRRWYKTNLSKQTLNGLPDRWRSNS